MLTPVDGTAEASRLQLERDRPVLGRRIGAVSWAVLVVALLYEVPQLIALLGIAALAAAVERALRFKSNRWLG